MSDNDPTTRMELFDSLIDEREGPCFNVKYELDGERDHVPIWAETEQEAEERFAELSSDGVEVTAIHPLKA